MCKKIVITKTPLRISLFGGGTDIKNFYKKNSGSVISTTIDKFVYVTVKEHGKLFNEKYRLNYSRTENKKNLTKIQNNIIRETLKKIKINKPVYISSISDIPSGSGLGSSSAFTVGLINALYEFKNKRISNLQLAKLACEIEIDKVKSPIGKQDQYATAVGGFNIIRFNKNSSVNVKKINDLKIIKSIFKNSLGIWIGNVRKTNKILHDQNQRFSKNEKNLLEIKKLTQIFEKNIKKKFSIDEFSKLLNKSWLIKNILSKKISTKKILKIYQTALNNGSMGGKVLGAGGGGFLFLLVKPNNKAKLKKEILKINKYIKIETFNFYKSGSEIILSL
jgi:D-glycero-alpha-D-manno-heptose-7-phosphate kinase